MLLQDCLGLLVFADCMVKKILNFTADGVNPNDLHLDILKKLKVITQASSEHDLQEIYYALSDERAATVFNLPATRFTKDHIPLMQSALVNNMVMDCRDKLDQFIEGLRTHDVLTIVREGKLTCLFSGSISPVAAAEVTSLLVFQYRQGSNRESDIETCQQFVQFLQATKGDGATFNNITLKPNNVLMWSTVLTEIPAVGFHKKIDIM